MTTANPEASAAGCLHCGLFTEPGTKFCCAGCAEVHELLLSRGLGHFYRLQKENAFLPPRPVKKKPLPTLVAREFSVGRRRFYLEGIHCLGCLWLLEKLPELEPGILEARLDVAHQILEVELDEARTSWTEVLTWISRLGYSARPLDESDTFLSLRKKDRIASLSRLGVAAFCTGNVMLLSVSIYAGAGERWSRHFGLLSAALAVPVLTYSAWPLYRAALLPLKHGRVSIDLAIVLALVSGILMSAWSLARGSSDAIYFDSMSMLVFLLLASRAFLQQMKESLAEESPALAFEGEEYYLRVLGEEKKSVAADDLVPGDRFELTEGQALPVDSTLFDCQEAFFDLSLLTGESAPVKYLRGDQVEAGSRLTSKEASFLANAPASESRLAKILAQIRAYELHRSPAVEFADRMGRRFVLVVLALCALLLFWKPDAEGLSRALALAIVTCPCVLAFAIPLTLTRALQRMAKAGILFRDAGKLEALASIRNIFFDKTGTLTTGEFRMLEWEPVSGDQEEARAAAFALETGANHPVGKAIARFLDRQKKSGSDALPLADFREVPGEGAEGSIGGNFWKLSRSKRPATPGHNKVALTKNGICIAELTLGDAIREEAAQVMDCLAKEGYQLQLLSGDSSTNAGATALATGIQKWHGGMKPEQKAELVSGFRNSLMVGDGANDAVAFRAASVSVAMQGAVELSLRHCDVLLTRPGLSSLPLALHLAQKTMRLVKTNFTFTLAYNLLAGALAISGNMSPLLAALLMPLSALTVFFFTSWQTNEGNFA